MGNCRNAKSTELLPIYPFDVVQPFNKIYSDREDWAEFQMRTTKREVMAKTSFSLLFLSSFILFFLWDLVNRSERRSHPTATTALLNGDWVPVAVQDHLPQPQGDPP
jgi:hypothetical protein